MKKRIFSIVLAVVMIVGMIPLGTMTVFATGTSYAITNGTPESDKETNHGYIAIDKTTAAEGETVTVTVNPADGYQLKSLTVTPAAPTEYTVTFDLNGITGKAPTSQKIKDGEKVTKPADPTDTVHTFAGWYKTKDATTGALSDPWDFDNDTVTANMTLYAQWTRTLESIYTGSDIPKVTNNSAPENAWVNGDGGKAFIAYSGKTSEVIYLYKKLEPSGAKQLSCRKTENFTKIGDDYVLDYYLSSSFYGKYTLHMTDGKFTSVTYNGAGTDYEELSGTYSAPAAPTEYNVTFDLNGISGTAPTAQTIEKDGKVTKPADPTDTVHTFAGWYKTKDATTGALSDPWDFDNGTVTANMTLYAQWTRTLESIYTGSDIPKVTNNSAPENAWVNGDGGKAFIAYSTGNTVLYLYKQLQPSGAKQLSCRKTENFTKIGDDYVLFYELGGKQYGVFTLHMTDSKFTSVTYDGAGTDYEVLSGTYTAPANELLNSPSPKLLKTSAPAAPETITPAKQQDGTYQFTMPEGNVTVTAVFAIPHTHTLNKVEAKDATCTVDGISTTYYVCEGEGSCGKYFSDENGENEISAEIAQGYTIGKMGHNFTGNDINYEGNKWAKKCSRCDTYDTENALTGVAVPTAKANLVYNGDTQTGVEEDTGYTLTGNTAKDAGEYTATATLKNGYIWEDGTTTPKEIPWEIISEAAWHLAEQYCDSNEGKGYAMGRQGKLISGNVPSEDIGRTIIPLTQNQLEDIGAAVILLGNDGETEIEVTLDCAYTYFYQKDKSGKVTKITAESMGYAAFLIIDNNGNGGTINGYGYYRLYNNTLDNFMFDCLFVKPETK